MNEKMEKKAEIPAKKKINKYDKAVSNPFEAAPITITLVWVENEQVPYPKPPHPN